MKYLSYIVATLLVLGCGGGGSGSISNNKVIINSDAQAIAYKVLDDAWETVAINSTKLYSFEATNNYKVVLKCSDSNIYLVALNAKSDKEVYLRCQEPLYKTVTLSGNLQDSVDGLSNFIVSADKSWRRLQNKNSYTLQSVTEGTRDILAITYSGSTPKRFLALRDQLIDKSHTAYTINFTLNNSATIESKQFKDATNTESTLVLITKNDTYFTSALYGKWFYANNYLLDSDYYILASKHNQNKTFKLSAISAPKMVKKDIYNDISYINPLQTLNYSSGVVSGFQSYQKSSKSPTLQGFFIDMYTKNNSQYHIMISKEYLGANDDFIIDDLSALEGFTKAPALSNYNSIVATAFMVNRKLGDIFKTIQLFKLHGSDFLDMPYMKGASIEIANQKLK